MDWHLVSIRKFDGTLVAPIPFCDHVSASGKAVPISNLALTSLCLFGGPNFRPFASPNMICRSLSTQLPMGYRTAHLMAQVRLIRMPKFKLVKALGVPLIQKSQMFSL